MRRITQQDIADRAGYDKSTVSLALSGSRRVSETTRNIINGIAEEMGYRPDPAITQLARYRWAGHEIDAGSVLVYLVERKLKPYSLQRRHFRAVKRRAEQRGYHLEEFDLSFYPTGNSASRVLYNRGIRGIIIPALPRGAELELDTMDWSKFTVVGCSQGWLHTPCDVVAPDIFEGTRLAWQKIINRGYRRIGAALCRHDPVAVDDHARMAASLVEQSSLSADFERIPFYLGAPNDRPAFMKWFRKYQPDVILGFVGHHLKWLREGGYSVPDDVAYACLNVFPGSELSGISVQFEEIGVRAVDYLLGAMRDHRWGFPENPEKILLSPRWIEGTSLPQKNFESTREKHTGKPINGKSLKLPVVAVV